ncbi:hypothetical protein OEZ85_002340 [Tetradesmus obliquus]|uniref:Peptidase S74 domain-containing protein n=1 Tax=Tetradesmus obliquus TaxID=3088 RepID=A0ABY8U2V2_TETOB|nr:hypothetical protein OEZ85_002340 [Tetradesmus obliquus]
MSGTAAGNQWKIGQNSWSTGAGNLGIGCTGTGGVASFSASGNLTVLGDITAFGSISDARLKTDIKPMDAQAAMETVSQLQPVQFRWKHDIFNPSRQGRLDEGLIAQEVAQVYPYAADTVAHPDGNVYNVVRYEKLTPLLVSSVQSLVQENSLLASTVDGLKQENSLLHTLLGALEMRVAALEAKAAIGRRQMTEVHAEMAEQHQLRAIWNFRLAKDALQLAYSKQADAHSIRKLQLELVYCDAVMKQNGLDDALSCEAALANWLETDMDQYFDVYPDLPDLVSATDAE